MATHKKAIKIAAEDGYRSCVVYFGRSQTNKENLISVVDINPVEAFHILSAVTYYICEEYDIDRSTILNYIFEKMNEVYGPDKRGKENHD